MVFPLAHTDKIIAEAERGSSDPITKVVCLAYDVRQNRLVGIGNNTILPHFKNNPGAKAAIQTPCHPDKKFLMKHAEIDLLQQLASILPDNRKHLRIYSSLQPCMNCVQALLDFGIQHIEWKENNRHQHEQEIIQKYINTKIYKSNPSGLYLQVPTYLLKVEDV